MNFSSVNVSFSKTKQNSETGSITEYLFSMHTLLSFQCFCNSHRPEISLWSLNQAEMSPGQGLCQCRKSTATASGSESLLCFTKVPMFSGKVFTLDVNILIVKQVDSLTYHSVCVCHLQELCAALSIPKGADPQAVGRMELLHEKVAAYINDLGQLEKTSCSQQTFYSVFL